MTADAYKLLNYSRHISVVIKFVEQIRAKICSLPHECLLISQTEYKIKCVMIIVLVSFTQMCYTVIPLESFSDPVVSHLHGTGYSYTNV